MDAAGRRGTSGRARAVRRHRQQPVGRDLQALADLAAQVCGVGHAAVDLVTETEQHQVAAAGFDASVCAREDSMCAAVLDDPGLVLVADASRDDLLPRQPLRHRVRSARSGSTPRRP